LHTLQPSLLPYTTLFRSFPGGHSAVKSATWAAAGSHAEGTRVARSRRISTLAESSTTHSAHRLSSGGPAASSPTRSSGRPDASRSEEHTSELQSRSDLVC